MNVGGDGGPNENCGCTEGQPELTGSLEHTKAKDTAISLGYKLQLNIATMDGRRQSSTEQNYTQTKRTVVESYGLIIEWRSSRKMWGL